jgi:hypothetical protein
LLQEVSRGISQRNKRRANSSTTRGRMKASGASITADEAPSASCEVMAAQKVVVVVAVLIHCQCRCLNAVVLNAQSCLLTSKHLENPASIHSDAVVSSALIWNFMGCPVAHS